MTNRLKDGAIVSKQVEQMHPALLSALYEPSDPTRPVTFSLIP